jgi:MoxR-like ATPase
LCTEDTAPRFKDVDVLLYDFEDYIETDTFEKAQFDTLQAAVKEVYVDQAVAEYIVRLVRATREHPVVYLGASPRGSLNLYRASQAFAAHAGRDYVIPDHVKQLAVAVLAHRLIVKSQASLREVDPEQIVREILGSIPVAEGSPAAGESGRARIASG